MVEKLRIGLDIDDTLVDFWGAYIETFGYPAKDHIITRNVRKLKSNKQFWENLKKLRDIDFVPELYCTKRINSKKFTRNSLSKNGFPIRPIYQMYYQKGNKAEMIKGRVDVFVDDSVSNYKDLIESGIPCLLIDSPGNQWFDTPYRIYDLSYDTIMKAYNEFRRCNN